MMMKNLMRFLVVRKFLSLYFFVFIFLLLTTTGYGDVCDILKNNNDCAVCTTDSIECPEANLASVPMAAPFLVTLNLTRNRIRELHQKSFRHLPLLITLDLSHNQIQTIPDQVFAGLGNLKKLWLNHNQIAKLSLGSFKSLHELEELHLHSNPLVSPPGFSIFRELFHLNRLFLHQPDHNDLSEICQGQIERSRFSPCFSAESVPKIMPPPIVARPGTTPRPRIVPVRNNSSSFPTIQKFWVGERVNDSITENGSAPILTKVPQSWYRVKRGHSLPLSCAASGDPLPDIKWVRFGRLVSFNASYTLENIQEEDEGIWSCVARNRFGKAVKDVKIIITGGVAPGSPLLDVRDYLGRILNHEPIEKNPLENITRFMDTLRLVMVYSDNGTRFQATPLNHSNLITAVQQMVMNNYTGCMGGARQEILDCYHEFSNRRAVTGICNNQENPAWGASGEPFLRLLPSRYDDDLAKPRGWFQNDLRFPVALPSPRKVTLELLTTSMVTNDPRHNHMLMQFGQFLDHDLTFAALSNNRNLVENDLVDCERTCQHVEPCFSIPRLDSTDSCIELKRSAEYCATGYTSIVTGRLIRREQVNVITAFIDGSQIYGNTIELAQYLRTGNGWGAMLRETQIQNRTYLPFNYNQDLFMDCQSDPHVKEECFLAGDHRANEQLGLLVMHNIWMRQHNRLVTALDKLVNGSWTGNRLFREARRIVEAQLQIITYRDWLPPVLGAKGLRMLGQYRGYNRTVNPSIANSFATAAMRFGHTLVNKHLIRTLFHDDSAKKDDHSDFRLHRAFFKPDMLFTGNLSDIIITGLLRTPLKKAMPEQAVNEELTERLFKKSRYTPLDLASINIQRGRDHGLPGYNDYREYCGLNRAKNFEHLRQEIRNEKIREKLQKLYQHPDHVDLWVGGILEEPDPDSKIGPTFRCLLSDQFRRLRDGDRFFYQNKGVFTAEQIRELEKTTLARIICDNSDDLSEVLPDSFVLPEHQRWTRCQELDSGPDLTKWIDR